MSGLPKAGWIKGVAHWREGDAALISVSFTWRLPEVRKIVEYYRAIGCTKIRIGGPGTFTQRMAEVSGTDVRLVLCDVCGSEGRMIRDGGVRLTTLGLDPIEIDDGECPECEGAGQLLVEVFPIELEDLEAIPCQS